MKKLSQSPSSDELLDYLGNDDWQDTDFSESQLIEINRLRDLGKISKPGHPPFCLWKVYPEHRR